jgi:hypothetical protein
MTMDDDNRDPHGAPTGAPQTQNITPTTVSSVPAIAFSKNGVLYENGKQY